MDCTLHSIFDDIFIYYEIVCHTNGLYFTFIQYMMIYIIIHFIHYENVIKLYTVLDFDLLTELIYVFSIYDDIYVIY